MFIQFLIGCILLNFYSRYAGIKRLGILLFNITIKSKIYHYLILNKIYFVFSASVIIFHEYMDRIFVRLIASCDKSRNLMLKQSFTASVLYETLMVSLNINCRSSAVYWKGLRYNLICYEMISYMNYKLFLLHREFKITNILLQIYKDLII